MPDRAIPDSPPASLLGFDFGMRRIGVAVGQSATRSASPLAMIDHAAAPDWPAIAALVREWRPAAFVVGLPLDGDGAETDMSQRARGFARELETRFGRPAYFMDERLSSSAARSEFSRRRAAGQARRKDAARLDALAASLILDDWLQSLPG